LTHTSLQGHERMNTFCDPVVVFFALSEGLEGGGSMALDGFTNLSPAFASRAFVLLRPALTRRVPSRRHRWDMPDPFFVSRRQKMHG